MNPNPLTLPAGALARPVEHLFAESSLGRAADLLRAVAAPCIPVSGDGRLIGVVTESGLSKALEEGVAPESSIEPYVTPAPSVHASASGAEVLRKLRNEGLDYVLVLDSGDAPIGLIAGSDLYAHPNSDPMPPMVGGMATPLGVYLTTGVVSGGPGHLALVLSGSLMFLIFLASDLATSIAVDALAARGLGEVRFTQELSYYMPWVLFLIGLRSMPMAGIHAAEHQVVHAMERREPLIPEVVARMPRVHPRCGTNLMSALAIFVGVSDAEWLTPMHDVRTFLGLICAFLFYKPVGSFLQWAVTTRPAKREHIESGIKAAEQLLERYRSSRRASPHPLERVVQSGMLHVMLGSALTAAVCHFVAVGLNLPLGW